MSIKKYCLEVFYVCAELHVEIDFDFVDSEGKKAEDYIKEMVQFWNGWEDRLARNKQDYIKTFLYQLSRFVFNHAPNCVLDIVEWLKEEEGWCYMDGSFGIKITHYDEPEISIEYIDIVEIN